MLVNTFGLANFISGKQKSSICYKYVCVLNHRCTETLWIIYFFYRKVEEKVSTAIEIT